ncbi:hypothetical protein CcrBL47_gp141 [Caulobacter phage BL47]|nr:hypothetical protein CcrBL47_gp141 [Caulobacter phage BL47]
MVDLVAGSPASVAYSGSAVDYVVKAAGQVDIHLWGGAGGGGYYANGASSTAKFGGAGGYTNLRFMADVNDVITVEVGQGGRVATGANGTATAGGLGGWPDGGFAAINSGAAWVAPGGGGGSTRIYKNGELIGVAGGGGATGFYGGGNGGGALGMASTDTSSGAGGTQTAGGVAGSGTLAIQSGSYFKGGCGGTTNTTSNAFTGGGGGGGLYGGASNGGGTGSHGSGGGGSGWIVQTTDVAGMCRAAPQDGSGAPINPAGISIPAGTAQGGTGPLVANTGWASITPGGNGFAYLSLTDPSATAAGLPSGATTVSYTGARQVYKVTDICSVDFEMWGGGGGGGYYAAGGNSARFGGAAGYTKLTKILYPGDIVEVEVAQGGQPRAVSARRVALAAGLMAAPADDRRTLTRTLGEAADRPMFGSTAAFWRSRQVVVARRASTTAAWAAAVLAFSPRIRRPTTAPGEPGAASTRLPVRLAAISCRAGMARPMNLRPWSIRTPARAVAAASMAAAEPKAAAAPTVRAAAAAAIPPATIPTTASCRPGLRPRAYHTILAPSRRAWVRAALAASVRRAI